MFLKKILPKSEKLYLFRCICTRSLPCSHSPSCICNRYPSDYRIKMWISFVEVSNNCKNDVIPSELIKFCWRECARSKRETMKSWAVRIAEWESEWNVCYASRSGGSVINFYISKRDIAVKNGVDGSVLLIGYWVWGLCKCKEWANNTKNTWV